MDQKALKKRLKALMQRPENQVCSDCPEKKPTWASLIVAPPGAPPGTQPIGAFCCLECSGSHRRLGVHISFVRSVNLDSWKEKEVLSMENGGNFKVNSIFEANLARSGVVKPTHLANGPTRERFIRDKYERRKFYDPAGYYQEGNSGGGAVEEHTQQQHAPPSRRPGAPSEAARQRVANRQARMKPSQSGSDYDRKPKQKKAIAKAPVSAPVIADLLDFGAEPASAPSPAPAQNFNDPFAVQPPQQVAAPAAAVNDPFAVAPPQQQNQMQQQNQPQAQPQQPNMPAMQQPVQQQQPANAVAQQQGSTTNNNAGDFSGFTAANMQAAAAQPQKPSASNNDIMALFNTPAQTPSGFGMQPAGMGGMMPNMMGSMPQQSNNSKPNNMGGAMPNNAQMMMGMQGGGAANMNMNPAQMQQRAMMAGNPQMAGMMNPQMMAMNNNAGGMQQMQQMQQQQQMMMMQRQQQMMMMNMMNNNNNNAGAGGGGMNNNFNAMMQGMQQVNLGGNTQQQQPQATGNAGGFPSSPMGGGFPASPMGGNVSGGGGGGGGTNSSQNDQSNDPFSSLGGMNAFR